MVKANEVIIFEGNAKIMASTPIQAEAYALYHSMCVAYTKVVRQAIFKSDCPELVRAIYSQQHPFEIATIIHDIKSLRDKFSSCEIEKGK